MSYLVKITQRSSTMGELFAFLWQRKLWWLLPLVVFLMLMGILFALAQMSSVAPWMYPL
jgi:hypothetical protein